MDERKLREIYRQLVQAGCFLDWEEWKEKVTKAYLELIKVAGEGGLITYSQLGIGKLRISPEWLYLKIGWIVGGCSEYEWMERRPLISSLVINAETGRPGQGFWGLSGIPPSIGYDISIGDIEVPPKNRLEARRDELWAKEVDRTHKQWQEGHR